MTLALGCVLPGYGIEPPTLTLLDVRPIPGGTFEQRLELDLLVQNANDFELAVDGLRLELDVNGQRLGRAVSNEVFELGRLDEARVTVQATITLFDVARQLLTLGASQRSFDYRLSGDYFLSEPRRTRLSFDDAGEFTPGQAARN